jgi:hypothetical protein
MDRVAQQDSSGGSFDSLELSDQSASGVAKATVEVDSVANLVYARSHLTFGREMDRTICPLQIAEVVARCKEAGVCRHEAA